MADRDRAAARDRAVESALRTGEAAAAAVRLVAADPPAVLAALPPSTKLRRVSHGCHRSGVDARCGGRDGAAYLSRGGVSRL